VPEPESDHSRAPGPEFACIIRREPARVVVSVVGDVDIASAPILREALRDATTRPTSRIVADFADVRFIDSSGVQALLAAQDAAADIGIALVVHSARPNVALVFELLGLADQLVFESAR
jgi:anti-sigma B factor antagonist